MSEMTQLAYNVSSSPQYVYPFLKKLTLFFTVVACIGFFALVFFIGFALYQELTKGGKK